MDYIARFLIGILLTGVAGEEEWLLTPRNFTAFLHSCVVIPCECTFPRDLVPNGQAKVWFKGHDKWDSVVAHSKQSEKVHPNFSHRTNVLDSKTVNNCTLLIENVTQSDAGKYIFRLEVNNDAGGKYTYRNSPFYISVSDVPNEPVLLGPAMIVEGKNTSLTCEANSSCPLKPPDFSWAGLNPIISVQRSGQYSSTLTFEPSYKDHRKVVQCLVQYQFLKIPRTGNITLAVKYSPRNTRVVFHKDGNFTGDVALTCFSDSNPEPHNYSWFRQDGEDEVSLGWHNRTVTVGRDSGNYRCVAFNTIGSDKSPPKAESENTNYIAIWIAILIIFVICVFVVLALILWIRSRRHQQFGTLGSPESSATTPQPAEAQEKCRNVYFRPEEDLYVNVREHFDIYVNCAGGANHYAANPGKDEADCTRGPEAEDLYANVSNEAKHWRSDQLDIY